MSDTHQLVSILFIQVCGLSEYLILQSLTLKARMVLCSVGLKKATILLCEPSTLYCVTDSPALTLFVDSFFGKVGVHKQCTVIETVLTALYLAVSKRCFASVL